MRHSAYHVPDYTGLRRAAGAAAALLALLLAAGGATARAAVAPLEKSVPEYFAKVAMLALFPEYITWPTSAFAHARAPIIIGIFGPDPFAGELEENIRIRQQKYGRLDRPVEVQYFASIGELGPCHLLFVPLSEERRRTEIARHYAQQPVLLMTDAARADDGFKAGFHLEFRYVGDQMRIRVDLDGTAARDLILFAELLELEVVDVVRSKPRGHPTKPAETSATPPR